MKFAIGVTLGLAANVRITVTGHALPVRHPLHWMVRWIFFDGGPNGCLSRMFIQKIATIPENRINNAASKGMGKYRTGRANE
jgi:hypothetical protein